MAHFNRLSPSGLHWAGESGDARHAILVDGVEVYAGGIQPVWLDEDRLLVASATDATLRTLWPRGAWASYVMDLPAPANRLEALNRHYLAWCPTLPGYVVDGRVVQSEARLTLLQDGSLMRIPEGCIEPRSCAPDVVVAVDHRTRPPTVYPAAAAPYAHVCHWAVPVATPSGTWVLRLEDDRLVLHPWGSADGIVVATGTTHHPDAVWCPFREAIAVVWTDAAGQTSHVYQRIDGGRVDLRRPVPVPDPPSPPQEPDPMPEIPPFAWDRCTIATHSAQDIAAWPITSRLGPITITPGDPEDTLDMPHTMAGRWPILNTAAWGEIEGSLWAFLPQSDGSWRAGTFDQLRPGQTRKAMASAEYHHGYAVGGDMPLADVIGYLVSTPARNGVYGPVSARSQLIIVAYPSGRVLWEEGAVVPPTPDPPPDALAELTARVDQLEAWARGLAYRR